MKRSQMAWLVFVMALFIPLPFALGADNPGMGHSAVEKRVALVIGNGAYVGENLGLLTNPTNDAEDIAKALNGFGFDVKVYKNLKKSAMDEAIVDFGRRASNADAALFYFAGHGLQIKSQNYLMPIDATANSEAAIGYEGVNVNYILEEMENARSSVNMVLLDACRNNSFSGQFRGGKQRGLAAPVSVPKGTVIVYATDPGNVASDGEGKNGLFTAGLLTGFKAKDLSLDGVLTTASSYVEEKSAREQTPYVNGPQTVMKQFMFRVDKAADVAPTQLAGTVGTTIGAVVQSDREALFWQSAQGDPEICQEYLKKYPQGEFVVPAKRCVEKSKTVAPVSPSPPPAPMAAENKLEPLDRDMVSGKTVQMRESADAQSKIVRELDPGEKAHVLGRTADGKWYWVEVKSWMWKKTGYVLVEGLLDETVWEESKRQRAEAQKVREESERLAREQAKVTATPKDTPAEGELGRTVRSDPEARKKTEMSASKGAGSALEQVRKAAEQGDAKAQFNLGVLYENGTGVRKDVAEAVNWYRKAAEQGHEAARTNLMKLGGAQVEETRKVPTDGERADFSSLSSAISQWQTNPPAPQPAQAPVNSEPAVAVEESRSDNGMIALWQRKIQSKIHENWNKPSGLPDENSLEMTVLVEVSQEGALINPRVGRTSGNALFDHSVIRAIQKTTKVERPPAGCLECQELEINFRPVRP
ncbi:MAG: caspase family protein [Magnetococcales bacterium]|nr:caspase family protein [Magnetococcales bacterium]